MKRKKEIKESEAIIGYVGAHPYAEVISGFTAFYLGAKSVCNSATMKVRYTNSWYDEQLEKENEEKLKNLIIIVMKILKKSKKMKRIIYLWKISKN